MRNSLVYLEIAEVISGAAGNSLMYLERSHRNSRLVYVGSKVGA